MPTDSKRDVKFLCTHHTTKCAEKSKHHVLERCATVKKVLANNPEYGVSIPGHSNLKKMRVNVPKFNMGKSGGYRTIYSCAIIDETVHILFLDVFFKGDKEDLTKAEYDAHLKLSAQILGDPLLYDWEDFKPPET